MRYGSVIVAKRGGPEVLQVVENDLRPPSIMKKYPILDAAEANELLESGQVVGNVVLVAPGLL